MDDGVALAPSVHMFLSFVSRTLLGRWMSSICRQKLALRDSGKEKSCWRGDNSRRSRVVFHGERKKEGTLNQINGPCVDSVSDSNHGHVNINIYLRKGSAFWFLGLQAKAPTIDSPPCLHKSIPMSASKKWRVFMYNHWSGKSYTKTGNKWLCLDLSVSQSCPCPTSKKHILSGCRYHKIKAFTTPDSALVHPKTTRLELDSILAYFGSFFLPWFLCKFVFQNP